MWVYACVKSVSVGRSPPSEAFSQVHAPAGREPQEHKDPAVEAREFSVLARSQVHSPAGRARQEHRGPETVFSVAALSHEHANAAFCPQEHLAWLAHTHWPWPFPQQEETRGILIDLVGFSREKSIGIGSD